MFAPGLDPLKVMQIAKVMGVGVREAIEIVKNKMGGEEVIEEDITQDADSDWKNAFLDKLNTGEIEWPTGPSIPLPGSKREPHPDDKYYPKTPSEGMQPYNAARGGRVAAQEGGLMNLGGMEKDYRQEGGFVPLGGEEKADDVPARLSKNEFVFTADAVRAAGGGDVDAGAEVMENVMENLEAGGEISEESQGLEGAQGMFANAQALEKRII